MTREGVIVLGPIAVLFLCQLAGEIVARGLALPVPGPVLGLAVLFLVFVIRPEVAGFVGDTARVILAHLSLLFVPAGVGVLGNLDLLAENWAPIAVVLIVSTLFAMVVTVGVFLAVRRLIGEAP